MKHYNKDPMNAGRGAGPYYKRSYKGNKKWMSKYDEDRDSKRQSEKSPYRSEKYKHTGDNMTYKNEKGIIIKKSKRI